MKVYLTFEKDGYGGIQVDRVFENKSDARMYVVTEFMIDKAKDLTELYKMTDKHIEEHEVIEKLKEVIIE